ncbi:MAG: transglycosylase domain-containing protein [bacterium]
MGIDQQHTQQLETQLGGENKLPKIEMTKLTTRVKSWVAAQANGFKKTFVSVAHEEYARRDSNIEARQKAIDSIKVEPGKMSWKKAWLETTAVIDKPVSSLVAAGRAAAMLTFYEWNPLAKLIGKAWTTEINGISGRELAARLEEKLIIDKKTGKGVRTGTITREKISDAITGGFKLAGTMNLIPGALSQLPVMNALGANPGEIWGLMRSAKMISGGPGSLKSFKKLWDEAPDNKERAKIVATTAISAPVFYALEKAFPVFAGVNALLVADMGFMRFAGMTEQYAHQGGDGTGEKRELATTKLHGQFMAVELGITAAFTADSALSLGERVVSWKETGMINPLAHMTKESELKKLLNTHPEYLVQKGGGAPGAIKRTVDESFEMGGAWLKGVVSGKEATAENTAPKVIPLHLLSAEGKPATYMVSKDGNTAVVTREMNGKITVLKGDTWEVVAEPQKPLAKEVALAQVGEQLNKMEVVAKYAVHDYVVYDKDGNMAIRMDLKPGEIVRTKMDRLFAGTIDDVANNMVIAGADLQAGKVSVEILAKEAGADLVYERQIVQDFIGKMRVDAMNNGDKFDETAVKERMIKYFEENTSLPAGTVEGTLSYDGFYKYLVGDKIVDTGRGTEHTIAIHAGDTLGARVAELGYSITDSGITDSTNNYLRQAVIYRVDAGGNRTEVPLAELGNIKADETYVLHTGEGVAQSKVEVVPIFQPVTGVSNATLTATPNTKELETKWVEKPVHNGAGEIYLGVIGKDGATLSDLVVKKLGMAYGVNGNGGSAWATIWPMLLDQNTSGISIYAEDVAGVKTYLRTKEDMSLLHDGDKIVIVDAGQNRVLRQVGELTDKPIDKSTNKSLDVGKPIDGFDANGKMDYAHPPTELIKDVEGMVYVGRVLPGDTLIGIAADRLGDYMLDNSGLVNLEYYKLAPDGVTVDVLDKNAQINVGDQIFAKDRLVDPILDARIKVFEVQATLPPAGGGDGLNLPENGAWDNVKLRETLDKEVLSFGNKATIHLTVTGINDDKNVDLGGRDIINNDVLLAPATMILAMRAIERGDIPTDKIEIAKELLSAAKNDATALDSLGQLITGKNSNEWVAVIAEKTTSELGLLNTDLKGNYSSNPIANIFPSTTTSDMTLLMQGLVSGKYVNPQDGEQLINWMSEGKVGTIAQAISQIGEEKVIEFSQGNSGVAIVIGQNSSYVIATQTDGRLVEDANSLFNLAQRTTISIFDPSVNTTLSQNTIVSFKAISDPATATTILGRAIYPTKTDNGWQLSPIITSQIPDAEAIDWGKMERFIRGEKEILIKLTTNEKDREIALKLDSTGQLNGIFDTKLATGTEASFERINVPESMGKISLSDDKVHVEPIFSFDMNVSDNNGRTNLVKYLDSKNQDFDYILFSSGFGEKPVLVATNYNNNETTGTGGVRIGIVLQDGGRQITDADSLVLQRFLGNNIDNTSWYTDISSNVAYDPNNTNAWYRDLGTKTGSIIEPTLPVPKSMESYLGEIGVPIDGVVDGVKYLGVEYCGTSSLIDRYLLGQEYGIEAKDVITRETNEAGVYLIGKAIAGGMVSSVAPRAYRVNNDPTQIDFTKFKVSTEFNPGDNSVVVYPLERDPNSVVTTTNLEKLNPGLLSERGFEKYQIQRADSKYFVPATGLFSGKGQDLYVDPLTMNVYVFTGKPESFNSYREEAGFYPVFGANLTYPEMASVIKDHPLDAAHIERDVYKEVINNNAFLDLRQLSDKYFVSHKGEVIEVVEKADPTQIHKLHIAEDAAKNLILDNKERLVYKDQDGKSWVIGKEGLEIVDDANAKTLHDVLVGYSGVVDKNGLPLQEKGFPLFEKNELLYKVGAEGLELIGSLHTEKASDWVADNNVNKLLTELGVTNKTIYKGGFSRDELASDADKIRHDMALLYPSYYLETSTGLYDVRDMKMYTVASEDGQVLYDIGSGKPILELVHDVQQASISSFPIPKDYFVMASDGKNLTNVVRNNFTRYNPQVNLLIAGNHQMQALQTPNNEQFVDRQTRLPIYREGDYAYVIKSRGVENLGLVTGLVNAGLVGVLRDGKYEVENIEVGTRLSQPLRTIVTPVGEMAYFKFIQPNDASIKLAFEDLSKSLESAAKLAIDGISIVVPNDNMNVKNVMDIINGEKYIHYESIPPSFVQMLLSQEDKRFMNYDDGAANNFHPIILARMLTNDGTGGSTIAQQVAKNLFMSTEERLSPNKTDILIRKGRELVLADKLIKDLGVEEILSLYANTMTYGYNLDGPIIGVERASEVIFGKEFKNLSKWEQSALVVVPNNPARFNPNTGDEGCVRGWADATASVYRHSKEIGVMTEAEAKEGMNKVFLHMLPNGDLENVLAIEKQSNLSEVNKVRLNALAVDYSKIDYDQRFEVNKKYIDFYSYIAKIAPTILDQNGLEAVSKEYYANYDLGGKSGRVEILTDGGTTPFSQTIPLTNPTQIKEIADGKPQTVAIDAPEMHVEQLAIKDVNGKPITLDLVSKDSMGNGIYRNASNQLYTLLADGSLELNRGILYIDSAGVAIQTEPLDSRPLTVIGGDANLIAENIVKDGIGNVYNLKDGAIDYRGRIFEAPNGTNVIYKSPRLDEIPKAGNGFEIYPTVVQTTLELLGMDPAMISGAVVLRDQVNPNKGVVPVTLDGNTDPSYRANPTVVKEAMARVGVNYEQVEFMGGAGSEKIFEQILTDKLQTGKPVIAWINMDDTFERKMIEDRGNGQQIYEAYGKLERAVTVLSSFNYNGEKYVVFLDPLVNDPKVVPMSQFSSWGAPLGGRYKMLVPDGFTPPAGFENVATKYDDPAPQVEMALVSGHTLDFERPTVVENAMTINPNMQKAVIEQGREMLKNYETTGMTAIAVDENGKVLLNVSLDSEGNVLPGNVAGTSTYAPGSVGKIASSLFSLVVDDTNPNTKSEAGEWYEFAPGYRSSNWRSYEYGGTVASALPEMTITQALADSNDPWFLAKFYESKNLDKYPDFLKKIGFTADGVYSPGLPNKSADYVVPDNRALEAMAATGQGNLTVTAEQLLALEYAVMHDGKMVALSAVDNGVRGPIVVGQLPGTSEQISIVKDGLYKASHYYMQDGAQYHGTSAQVFDNSNASTAYEMLGGKTGTSESGGEYPHASFTGTAIDPATGKEVSLYLVIKNVSHKDKTIQESSPAGGGSLAAPMAKKILDTFYSDQVGNSARNSDSPKLTINPIIVEKPPVVPIELPPTGERDLATNLMYEVKNFNVENQPNAAYFYASTHLAEKVQKYVDNLNGEAGTGRQLFEYLDKEMGNDEILALVKDKPEIKAALRSLRDNYNLNENDNDPTNDKQPVQCVGWQIMNAALAKELGNFDKIIPITAHDAAAEARELLSVESGQDYGGGKSIRFAVDTQPQIDQLRIGDSVYVSYTESIGHVMTILSTGTREADGQSVVLVQDSNHFKNSEGVIVEDGVPRIRWMSQNDFVNQYQVASNTAKFAINRVGGEHIEPVETQRTPVDSSNPRDSEYANIIQNYQIPPKPVVEGNGRESEAVVFDGAEYRPLDRQDVGESTYQKPNWFFVHWSGIADKSADSIVNYMSQYNDSSTFAIGSDKVVQMTGMTGSTVQSTNAALQHKDAINVEVAGVDFDTNPPDAATYKNLIDTTITSMIQYNIPISHVMGHYQDHYITLSDGSFERVEVDGADVNGDGYINGDEITKVFALNNGERVGERVIVDGESQPWQKMDPGILFMNKFREDIRTILQKSEGSNYSYLLLN